jgi:hypothetical protein
MRKGLQQYLIPGLAGGLAAKGPHLIHRKDDLLRAELKLPGYSREW